jgi:GNAT superfamily N-acetyltransferase
MIRPARPGDVPTILALVHELAEYEREPDAVEMTESGLRDALFGADPKVWVHVAEESGEVVGHALWYVNFSTWSGRHGIWLDDLYVRPEHRGKGHGLALLRALAAICIERAYARLEWWVLDWNEPAIGFYRSLGAVAMDEWTVNRVTGEALHRLASP